MTRLAASRPPQTRFVHNDQPAMTANGDRLEWSRLWALAAMHIGCLAVVWVGWSWTAIATASVMYLARAFGLTAFYHRYFSHRAFKTSRWLQFCGGLLGCLALQKGPLWWAAHHRDHHRLSDRQGDVHSPHVHGFVWAHMGWFLTTDNNRLRSHLVRDWLRYPELAWLDRAAPLVAVAYGVALYAAGAALASWLPALGTTGGQMFVWGFFVSTVALYHATYSVNSLAHLFGERRFATTDHSRNNWLVALATLGEGWHNNHHQFPTAARQGLAWWEFDPTYYMLLGLARVGLVWDLRPAPPHALRPSMSGGEEGSSCMD